MVNGAVESCELAALNDCRNSDHSPAFCSVCGVEAGNAARKVLQTMETPR